MKAFWMNCIPAVLHCILTFAFLKLMLNSPNDNLFSQLSLVLTILVFTNALAIGLIAKGKLRILSQQIWIYTVFSLVIVFLLYSSGTIELAIESLLHRSVIIHAVLLPFSLLSNVVGTLIGVIAYQLVMLYKERRNTAPATASV